MLLLDSDGRATDAATFPDAFTFTLGWLGSSGVARLADGEVTIELGNARARYRVDSSTDATLTGALVDFELFDPPAIDEALAEQLLSERRTREIGELVEQHGITPAQAESILTSTGRLPARTEGEV